MPGAARRHPRPRRQGPGREPDRARAPGPAARTCRSRGRERTAVMEGARAGHRRRPRPRWRPRSPRSARSRPASPVILKKGLGAGKVFFLRENQDQLPRASASSGSSPASTSRATLAAHLFGNVGEVTAEQLDQPRYATLEPGDVVGQSGIEYEYDRFLRGKAGRQPLPGRRPRSPDRPARERAGAGRRQRPAHDRRRPPVASPRARSARSGCPAPSWRWTSTTARSWRWARRRASTPRSSAGRSPRASTRQLTSRGDRRAAGEPRDPGPLSDRLGVQADHRDRRARRGPDHPGRRSTPTPAWSGATCSSSRTPATRSSGRST